ncbi:MICOS complex subunit MIC10-like [Musa acuminata AAA Group]|uniref:MICOS complex subunit MIC10-like n=1 Tax=Musa acuminata AAA Group TaxID=214697 RepID=UPI0031D2D120
MAEEQRQKKAQGFPPPYDLNAKWDACLDLTARRLAYSSLAGAFTALLFFRSPVTRWASVAFGAGLGIGSAYTDCSYIFDGSPPKVSSSKISAIFTGPPPREDDE